MEYRVFEEQTTCPDCDLYTVMRDRSFLEMEPVQGELVQ